MQSTISSKGQTTIPKEIRDILGLQAQDKVYYLILSDGTVMIKAKKRSITSLYGAYKNVTGKTVKIDLCDGKRPQKGG